MTLRTRLGLRVRITEYEWDSVSRLSAAHAVLVLGAVWGFSSANGLLLQHLGPAALLRAYVVTGFVMFVAGNGWLWLIHRLTLEQTARITFGVAMAALAALALLPPSAPLLGARLVAAVGVGAFPTLVLWMAAGDLYDAHAARRTFRIIKAGGAIGAMAAGLAAPLWGRVADGPPLLIAWVGCLAVAFVLLASTPGALESGARPHAPPAAVPMGRPLICTVGLAILTGWMIATDFTIRLAGAHPETDAFVVRYAQFAAAVGLASLLLASADRLTRLLGVVGTLWVAPAVLLGPVIVLAWQPNLAIAAACLFIQQVLGLAIVAACVDTMAAAVPSWRTASTIPTLRTLLAVTMITPAGQAYSVGGAAIPVVVLAWMASLVVLRRRYLDTLVGNLQSADEETRLESLEALERLTDRAVDRVLEQSLRSTDPDVVVFALELLREPGFEALAPGASACLGSPHARVRGEALRTLARCAPDEAPGHLFAALADEAPGVRLAALEAAARLLDRAETRQRLLAEGPSMLASESDPALVAAWIELLARAGWDEREVQAAIAARRLRGERLAAAHALCALSTDPAVEDVALLLEDPDPVVRAAAARAVRGPHDVATTRRLLALLGDPRAADAAAQALQSSGSSGVLLLREALTTETSIAVRTRICEVLARIGSPPAVDGVMRALSDSAAPVRAAAARALRATSAGQLRADVADPLRAEAVHAQRVEAQLGALRAANAPRGELLIEELERQLGQSQEALSILTSLSENRATVQEMVPVGSAEQVMVALAADDDPWLSRCARWARGEEDETVTVMERVLFLRQVELFRAISGRDLAVVAESVQEEAFPRDVSIFEEGAAGDSLYLLTEGSVAVVSGARIVQILGPRECFGEMALLSGEPRSASIRTLDATRVLTMRRDDFRDLIVRYPHVAFPIFEILSRRLKQTTEMLKKEEPLAGHA